MWRMCTRSEKLMMMEELLDPLRAMLGAWEHSLEVESPLQDSSVLVVTSCSNLCFALMGPSL